MGLAFDQSEIFEYECGRAWLRCRGRYLDYDLRLLAAAEQPEEQALIAELAVGASDISVPLRFAEVDQHRGRLSPSGTLSPG